MLEENWFWIGSGGRNDEFNIAQIELEMFSIYIQWLCEGSEAHLQVYV